MNPWELKEMANHERWDLWEPDIERSQESSSQDEETESEEED